MTTTIIFIRHGLTDWNLERRWQGHLDVPLNDEGIGQAQALSQRIAAWPIKALYSSDLRRASQTAEIIGSGLGLQTITKKSWRERDVGRFEGLDRDQIKNQYPRLFMEMKNGIMNPPGGESSEALSKRGVCALQEILALHPDEMVAVVSHGGILVTILLHVLGLSIDNYDRVGLSGNTGLSIVEANNGRMRLTRLNDTAHLE